jgi:hypothetical protein
MAWKDDYLEADGYIFSYEITSPADICPRSRLHIDDWYPDVGTEWALTGISDADTGATVTMEDVATAWDVSESEAQTTVDGMINKEVGNG